MGTDIFGWVEEQSLGTPNLWEGVLRIDALVGRNQHGFGSMFMEEGLFKPVAVARGLPDNLSDEAKLREPEEYWGHTWASWAEIAAIDWNAWHVPSTPLVYRYQQNAKGEWEGGMLHNIPSPDPIDLSQSGEVMVGDVLYRVVPRLPVQRRETLHPGWQIVFETMRFLVTDRHHSDTAIRLVVWFG